jgi:hypothetical protein
MKYKFVKSTSEGDLVLWGAIIEADSPEQAMQKVRLTLGKRYCTKKGWRAVPQSETVHPKKTAWRTA